MKTNVIKPKGGIKAEWHNTMHFGAPGADTVYVSALGLSKDGQSVLDTFFQASAATQVFCTLSPAEQATNPSPNVQAGILWDAPLTVPAGGAITKILTPYTALKIVFTGPTELHLIVA